MISQSAKTYLANPTDFDSLEGIMMKGFMNDYGKIDQCKTIPSAQYCYTQILPKMIDSGGNAAATAGLCLPETCPAEAIQFVWKTLFDMPIPMGNSTGAASTMQVSSVFATKTVCGDQSVEWTIASVLVLVLCCLLAALVIVSTTIVLWADSKREAEDSAGAKHQESSGYKAISEHEEKAMSLRLLECFSLTTNLKKFCEIRSGTATSCLDGIRVFSMCWVVMGHTLVWPLNSGAPGYTNPGDIVPFFKSDALTGTFTGQAILSAEFSVDSFFFMSGFLATYIGIKKIGGLGKWTPLKAAPFMYIDRWLRLTPVYLFVLLTYTYLLPALSSGPFWTEMDQEACKENMWQNLLYVQTLFAATGARGTQCYGVSWYLADDMMFFYLVPIIISIAVCRLSFIYGLSAVVSVASIVAGLIVAQEYTLSPSPFDKTGLLYMAKYYYPPWMRVAPYLIGTSFGILWRDHQVRATALLQQRSVQAGTWLLSAVLLGSCMWGNAGQFTQVPSGLYTDRVRGDLFISLAKPAWTIGLALMCALCFARVAGPVQWILEAPMFGYLSKLTFTVYLLHPIMLFVWLKSLAAPIHFSIVAYSMWFVAILFTTTALAFVVHLTIEQPTANLLFILMAPRKRPTKDVQGKDGTDANAPAALLAVEDSRWSDEALFRHSMPLPFEGESSYLPPGPRSRHTIASPTLLPLALGAPPTRVKTEDQLCIPLAGPEMESDLLAEMA